MERIFLFIALLLLASNSGVGQVPRDHNIGEPQPMIMGVESELFTEHISEIIHTRELRKRICTNKLFDSKKVFVSLEKSPASQRYLCKSPLCCDRYNIFLQDKEEIFLNVCDKYLRVKKVTYIDNNIFYEVITHSGGKGKTCIELHCIFNFELINGEYELVKSSFNEVPKMNIRQYSL